MTSSTSISKGLLALVLPMVLVSVFIGCVLSCSSHSEGALEYHAPDSVEIVAVADDCEGCPLTNELSGGLPTRQNLALTANDGAWPVLAPATFSPGKASYFRASLLMPPPGHDPPHERLFALRI